MDKKDRAFYDNLSEEERKSFSAYLALRYVSAVKGDQLMQNYYARSTNVHANKSFFSLGKEHVKLQWLVLTTVSPGAGNQSHEWIAGVNKKSDKKQKKKLQALMQLHPTYKISELEMMSDMMTDKEVDELVDQHGIKLNNWATRLQILC